MLFHNFQVGLEDGRHTMNLLANLQERLVQSEQGPVVLGTPTSTNTGEIFVGPLLANLQERLVQSEQGPVVLGTPTSTNTGEIFVGPLLANL